MREVLLNVGGSLLIALIVAVGGLVLTYIRVKRAQLEQWTEQHGLLKDLQVDNAVMGYAEAVVGSLMPKVAALKASGVWQTDRAAIQAIGDEALATMKAAGSTMIQQWLADHAVTDIRRVIEEALVRVKADAAAPAVNPEP